MRISDNNVLKKNPEGWLDLKGRIFSDNGAKELNALYRGEIESLSACPFCGSKNGVYAHSSVSYVDYFEICGTPILNSGRSNAKVSRGVPRCGACHKELADDIFKKKVIYKDESTSK